MEKYEFEYEKKLNIIANDFGKDHDDSNVGVNNILSEQDILDFEKRQNIKLPDDYKHFLLNYNGVYIFKDDRSIRTSEEFEGEDYGLNFEPVLQINTLDDVENSRDLDMFEKTIYFARPANGMFAMSLREEDYGSIYYGCDEWTFNEEDIRMGSIVFLAKSFSEFIEKLEIPS